MARLSAPLDATNIGSEARLLEHGLRQSIVGQDEAVDQIVNVYQMFLTGMQAPGRPVGNFLFLGPTGSGKTRIVEAASEILAGTPRAVVKIDCGEFQHSHEIAKLVGSPPGYLGHRETHPMLSQETLNEYLSEKVKLSFVLFDEIEKASDSLWNLLLGILDKATLTLGDGRRVDFSRSLIFMTSNLGASAMTAISSPRLGFCVPGAGVDMDGKIAKAGVEAARRKFTPEFVNRLDKIVVFRSLGDAELRRILEIELGMVQERIFQSPSAHPFVFSVTAQAKDFLLREGTDLKYGARHLKRAVERSLVQPMSNLIASGQLREGDWVCADYDPLADRMAFRLEAEDVSPHAMADLVRASMPLSAAA
ncbi:MAG: AAA family ATPase [Bryobacteraceae bacterium]